MPLLLLDLDNTLIDRAGAVGRWARKFAAAHGRDAADAEWLVAADRDGLEPRDRFAGMIAERFGLGAQDEVAIVAELRGGLVSELAADDAVTRALRGARAAGWTPFVVTNGTVAQQERKLRHTGLDREVGRLGHLGRGGPAQAGPGDLPPRGRDGRAAAQRGVDDQRFRAGRHRGRPLRGAAERVAAPRPPVAAQLGRARSGGRQLSARRRYRPRQLTGCGSRRSGRDGRTRRSSPRRAAQASAGRRSSRARAPGGCAIEPARPGTPDRRAGGRSRLVLRLSAWPVPRSETCCKSLQIKCCLSRSSDCILSEYSASI